MILNKFSPVSRFQSLKALGFQLLALTVFSCNKTANISANKAFVGLTHVAYGVGPVTVTIDSLPLFAGPLGFGMTSGDTLFPYDTTTSRISDMTIRLAQDASVLLNGNATFQQGSHYSAFLFDSLNRSSVGLIIFQNNAVVRTDTNTYIRYLNFSPLSNWALKLINRRKAKLRADTVVIAFSAFVGYNPNPGSYKLSLVRIGKYDVYAFKDSINPNIDSSNVKSLGYLPIDTMTNYNIYLQGFSGTDTGQNKFQLKYFPLN